MATSVEKELQRKGRMLTESGQNLEEFEAPEISPEEFADHLANVVANALVATKMFGLVEIQAGVGQVHIMGRVKKEKEKAFMAQVVRPILTVVGSDDCRGFVGKQFLLKDGDVRYAWVVSFASNDLRKAAAQVCQSFENLAPRAEVTESPLLGRGTPQSGGRTSGRKGASPVM